MRLFFYYFILVVLIMGCGGLNPKHSQEEIKKKEAVVSPKLNPLATLPLDSFSVVKTDSIRKGDSTFIVLKDTTLTDSLGMVLSPDTVKTVKKSTKRTRKKPKNQEPKNPLICVVHPGTMEGYGDRGEYLMTGNVVCQYGTLKLMTNKALWHKKRNEVVCEGGVTVLVNGMTFTSIRGGYKQDAGELWAERSVKVVDSNHLYEFTGQYMTYNRNSHWLTVTGSPDLKRFYRKKKGQDTLSLTAEKITYNDSLRIAVGEENVNIVRGNLKINCEKGSYFEKEEQLSLEGNPVAHLKTNLLKGKSMLVHLKGEQVTSISLKDSAYGVYYEKASANKIPKNTYKLESDSLYMKISKEVMEYVELFDQGKVDQMKKKDSLRTNKMFGDYLRLNFLDEKIQGAQVNGNAKTQFHLFEENNYKGKSVADGDSIHFAFEKGDIVEVNIAGNAQGTFYGEPKKEQSKKKEAEVKSDSTQVSEKNEE